MFTIIGADGKEYGPVTAASITQWIAAGRANLQTKARREGETEWKPLSEFAEFATTPPVLGAPVPPTPTAVVTPVAYAAPTAPAHGLELADRWVRLGAAVLDGVIGGIFVIPGFVLMAMAGVFATPNSPNPALMAGGFIAFAAGILILLGIQIYLLVTRGQTIGKKILGIKIVNFDDGTNPGFVKVFLLRIFVNGLIGAVPFLGIGYSLADILFIFRDDHRCIHDLIAGTLVVKA